MTTRTYPEGVTSWIDVEVGAVDDALEFYGGLLGWTFVEAAPPEAPVRYVVAQLDGHDAAAVAGPRDRHTEGSCWNTYVAVDDAELVAAKVEQAGGRVLQPPTPAGEAGVSVVCADPHGVEFRLWQAGARRGAQVTNAPGAWNFSNLHTDHPEVATDFYAPVLGWRVQDLGWATWLQVPGYGDHLAATVDPTIRDRQSGSGVPDGFADVIGGVVSPVEAEASARWDVVFTVEDRDVVADRVVQLGGAVVATDDDVWTKAAVAQDPQGGRFTLSQFTPPDDAWDDRS